MQGAGEIALPASVGALMVVFGVVMYGHRAVARRLVKDPEKRPQRSVELATFWPLLILATAFPLMALWMPARGEDAQPWRWVMTGFFAFGVIWMLIVRRWEWYLRYATNTAFAVTMGSRDHGETPEMYRESFERALPWAAVLMGVAFVIALVRAVFQF